jgi:hypothetical protein
MPCATLRKRITFIEDASKRLFEEKITVNVADSLFKKILSDYEREITSLKERLRISGGSFRIRKAENPTYRNGWTWSKIAFPLTGSTGQRLFS